jgi:hypothetical protein
MATYTVTYKEKDANGKARTEDVVADFFEDRDNCGWIDFLREGGPSSGVQDKVLRVRAEDVKEVRQISA